MGLLMCESFSSFIDHLFIYVHVSTNFLDSVLSLRSSEVVAGVLPKVIVDDLVASAEEIHQLRVTRCPLRPVDHRSFVSQRIGVQVVDEANIVCLQSRLHLTRPWDELVGEQEV